MGGQLRTFWSPPARGDLLPAAGQVASSICPLSRSFHTSPGSPMGRSRVAGSENHEDGWPRDAALIYRGPVSAPQPWPQQAGSRPRPDTLASGLATRWWHRGLTNSVLLLDHISPGTCNQAPGGEGTSGLCTCAQMDGAKWGRGMHL